MLPVDLEKSPKRIAEEREEPMGHDTANPAWDIARLRPETTHQMTTFNLPKRSKTVHVGAGETRILGSARGAGFVSQLWLTFPGWFWQHWATAMPVSQSILKTLILRLYWDDEEEPAIAAPMGDFFGVGLGEYRSFASRYLGMSSGGFFCKLTMPFRRGFRVEVENRDEAIDTDLFCNILYQLTDDVPEDAGYLHAQFRTARLEGSAPVILAECEGRGHYAGCTLAMQGEDQNYLGFLEAPEHVFIDDDWETPRIVGTGLEDYFLGGWYFREGEFAGSHHGVPVKNALDASVAMYRIHDSDAIRFKQRLRFQFLSPMAWKQRFAYSSVAFLYVDRPGGQAPPIPPRDALMCWYRVRNCDHQSIP